MVKTIRQIRKTMRGYSNKLAILEKEEAALLLPQQYIYDKWLALSRSEYSSMHEAYNGYTNVGGLWDFKSFSQLFVKSFQRQSFRDGDVVSKKYIKH